MEFSSPGVQKAYERITPMLERIFGDSLMINTERPVFMVRHNSAYIGIYVNSWQEGEDATVQAYSHVVTGAEVTTELMRFLLSENASLRFGAFGLDSSDNIVLQCSIVGSTCDPEGLRACCLTTLLLADEYDDKIVARFGGERAIDTMPQS